MAEEAGDRDRARPGVPGSAEHGSGAAESAVTADRTAPPPARTADRPEPSGGAAEPGPEPRPEPRTESPSEPEPGLPAWVNRTLIVLAVLVVLIVAGLALSAVLPRWWAHRIGRVADGSLAAGVAAGLTLGVVFTAAALAALRGSVRRGRSWRARGWLLLLALLVAVPNLITLGIVIGSGDAAHAGERTLDVEAPGFRGGTLAGCVIGAVLMAGLWFLLSSRRRHLREIDRLRAELASARGDATAADSDGDPIQGR